MNTKKRTAIYKALAITFALLFTVLFLPVGQIHAYALIAKEYTDYSYITIGESGEVSNTIYTGNTYTIPRAFIGGNTSYSIGEGNIAEGGAGQQVGDSDVTIKSSKITVTYGSPTIVEGEYVNGVEVNVTETPDGSGYGTFKANSIGTYTITYSYTYTVGSGDSEKTYTNYYDMKVESSVTSASMELDNNSVNVLPDNKKHPPIDLSLISTTDGDVRTFTKEEIALPLPTIYDEDGEEVENYEILLEEPTEDSEEELPTDCLVVTVNGGVKADNINSGETKYLKMSGDDVVIDTDVFNDPSFEESFSKYTIKYAYYHQGQFIISTTRSFNTRDKYYENYNKNNLTLRTSSTLTTSAQPGVEQTLPGVTVTTNSNVNHSDEEVAVHYTVKVRYRASGSGSYADLDQSIYNADPENKVLNEDGTLIDPTKFTPLQEGTYTFIYTATDFYGNVVASEEGTYVWRNIEDTTDPTPVIYDASVREGDVPTYENADHKLKTQTKPNGVIVYAVGIDDNLSKSGDSDVDLKREVYSGDTERLFTIENYDEYNLIFNYRASSDLEGFEHNAYQNFIDNNYLIRKALGETSIGSDAEMLTWLKGTKAYLIVVDNANYTHIYNYFTTEINAIGASITDASSFLNFAKNKANMQKLIGAGFAYVDSDSIFGANQANGGYNTTSYTIRYYAEDTAGNSAYSPRSMSFNSTTEDTVPPTLSFSTIFQDIYLGEDEVTFSFPTASDEVDSSSRMKVHTYYRFLNNDSPITNLTDADGNTSSKDLDDEGVWGDVVSQANRNENGALFSTEYEGYRTEGNDGYFDITNTEEDSYTIDLSLAPNANKVQIFAFVYDDYGNVGVIGREFAVSNVNDQAKPTFVNVQVDDTNTSFQQGATITLPTINVQDDYVNYMTYNISVSHVNNGTRTSITSPTDSTQNRNANRYSYSVNGGTFTAPFAGTYNVSIELKDSGNNRIVVFTNYETSVRPIVQEPQISTSLTSQTVELDENPVINIPTPKIEYSIDNSIDYDSYINGNYAEGDDEFSYVLRGVDANGNATNYSVGEGQINSFTPERVGEYTFKYDVRFTAYNPKVLEYNAGTYTPGTISGEFDLDYYTLAGKEGVRIIIVDENTYRVQYNSKTYTVSQNEGSVTVTPDGEAGADDLNGVIELDNLFTDLRYYNLTSQNYTITVKDTTAPELASYDYPVSLSAEDVNSTDGAKLKIQGIKATDRSGIDYEASSVQVRIEYRTDEGTQTSTYDNLDTVEEKMNGKEIIVKRNGTIYITYTVVDNAGNKTEGKEITIQAGDITAPTVEIEGEEDDFINVSEGYTLSSIQKNDNLFRIDLTKIRIDNGNGAKTPAEIEDENVIVKYELVNNGTTSGDDNDGVIDLVSESENELVYEITEVGEYTFTITVQDEHNNVETREFTFSVHEEETDPNAVYQIVGIILIVISVLVLVGVIVYFVVSKVRLDKELKK